MRALVPKIGLSLVCFLPSLPLLAQAPSPPLPAEADPVAYVQILNGICPGPVSISIEGLALYENIGPGTRVSSFGIKPKAKVTLKDMASGAEKAFPLELEAGGYYTLCLTGDFAKLPQADPKEKPDYRVNFYPVKNSKPSGNTVEVSVVNGLLDRSIQILNSNALQCEVAPGKVAVARSQPAALLLKAKDGRDSLDLYLAQETPAKNLSVVFFEKEGRMAFRAVTQASAP